MTETFADTIHQGLLELLPNAWVRSLALVVGALILAKLADLIISGWFRLWAKRTETDLDDQFLEIIHRPVFLTVLFIGLWLGLLEIEASPTIGTFVGRVLVTLAIFVWSAFAFKFLGILLAGLGAMERRFEWVQPRTLPLLQNVGRVVMFGLAVYALFLAWGIDVTAWLASAGILGIAVGFAAKDSLANLFGGVFVLVDSPYQKGDFIVLDSGERGMVTAIGLRSTRLQTRDDVQITIPNAVIANAKITNQTGGRWEKFRVRIKIGVAYGSDIDLVREVLMSIAVENEFVADDPEPRVRFRAFGDSSLDFELLGWIDEPVLRGQCIDSINTAIYKRFIAEGIQIPFPQRDVWLRSEASAPVEAGDS